MAIGTRSYARGYLSSSGLPPGIRGLLISNVAIFLIYFFASRALRDVFDLAVLRPIDVVQHFYVWQLVTYMFLHQGIAERPLLLLGVMLVFIGVQLVTFGLLAEVMARTYYESQDKPTYVIREIRESTELAALSR